MFAGYQTEYTRVCSSLMAKCDIMAGTLVFYKLIFYARLEERNAQWNGEWI
jgi:hypothetical protein